MRIVTLENTDEKSLRNLGWLPDVMAEFIPLPKALDRKCSEEDPEGLLGQIELLATDMDGTLTQNGQFGPEMLAALQGLQSQGLPVIIVTGRSAGWVSGLAQYLPVAGAICENGGVFFRGETLDWLVPMAEVVVHRGALKEMFEQLRGVFPQIRESSDNRFRLTDWTFDVAGLSLLDLGVMDGLCRAGGWSFTYSTVQCHIKLMAQDKARGLKQVLQKHFPGVVDRRQVLVVGDSPNDQSLFEGFPLGVGVANLRDYAGQMAHLPRWITREPEGAGFCELAKLLMH